MRKLSKPINLFGLTIGPIALLSLLTSCALLLSYFGCPYYFNLGWILGRANRSWPVQFAIAEAQSLTIASFFNEIGGPAFPWGPRGSGSTSATALLSRTVRYGLRVVEDDPSQLATPTPAPQNFGSPIYIVGAPSNSVTVLNSETGSEMTVIQVGMDPRWIQPSADHLKAYVSNFGSNSVSVIDAELMAVEQTLELPDGSGPIGVAPSPDRHIIYVVNSITDTVVAIDRSTGSIIRSVDVGDGAMHIAVSPDGQLAYVTNQDSGTVSVIDTFSMELITTVEGIPGATSVVFEDRGRRAFVTGGGSGPGRLHVIGTSDHSVAGTIPVGTNPVSVRLSPYGNFLFVANRGSGTITIIDVRNETVRQTVPVGQAPVDVAAIL